MLEGVYIPDLDQMGCQHIHYQDDNKDHSFDLQGLTLRNWPYR